MMPIDINELIINAQSAIDDVRKTAEANLLQLCDENAAHIFVSFINVAMNNEQVLSSRQFALFALRKLITMYWSPGFESYRATSTINESEKALVRDYLLRLSLQDSSLSKLRNAASYCVVQICAVDFPDEWPDLLQVIYESILNDYSLSAMSLLNEIYDDVVSEEMFFEGGIGLGTINIIFQLLKDPTSNFERILLAQNLFHSCLSEMLTVSSSSSTSRKQIAIESIKEVLKIWHDYLQYNSISKSPECIPIRSRIYEDLALLKSEFPKKLLPQDSCLPFKVLALNDLEECANAYASISETTEQASLPDLVPDCAVRVLEFLTAICDFTFESQESRRVVLALETLCCYSDELIEDWPCNFNIFVSTEAGLAASFTIRDQATEFLSSLNDESFEITFECILGELSTLSERKASWKNQESLLYLFQSIISNDTAPSTVLARQVHDLPTFLHSIMSWKETNQLVQSRVIIMVPKLLEKFIDSFEDVKALTRNLFLRSLEISLSTSNEIIKASLLISFTYYSYFADLESVLGSEICEQVQIKILRLIDEVSQEAEDDTDGLLIEIISLLIDCNSEGGHKDDIIESELHHVLVISAKDPSNIQTIVASQTCLRKILHLDSKNYTKYAEGCLPSFLKIIKASKPTKYCYNPLLSLSLQFLDAFMEKKPIDASIPSSIIGYVFEPLTDVLLESNDDDVLQIATSSFSHLVYNSDVNEISPRLQNVVRILDRLLSFDVSDIAAQQSGSLIVTIFSRFPMEIQSMVPVILKAVTGKLTQATNITTSQNLLSVFCYLTSVDAQQTVDFLSEILVQNEHRTALSLILSKWVGSFEEIRSDMRIKENILALKKLFLLQDPKLADLKVNGDIIPYQGDQIITRSKAKEMPDIYSQVSFYAKIIKLFVAELDVQDRHDFSSLQDSREIDANKDDIYEAEDWEDVEDILEYEKLQEYVQDSDEEENGLHSDSDKEIAHIYDLKPSIKEMLLEFFKEVMAENVNNFQNIYNSLTEAEKKILSDNLI